MKLKWTVFQNSPSILTSAKFNQDWKINCYETRQFNEMKENVLKNAGLKNAVLYALYILFLLWNENPNALM